MLTENGLECGFFRQQHRAFIPTVGGGSESTATVSKTPIEIPFQLRLKVRAGMGLYRRFVAMGVDWAIG